MLVPTTIADRESSFFFSIATVFCPINSYCLLYKSVFVDRGVVTFGPVKQIVAFAPSTSFSKNYFRRVLEGQDFTVYIDHKLLTYARYDNTKKLDNWIMYPYLHWNSAS